jgi:hypothetical protein
MRQPTYVVTGADRSGETWTVGEFHDSLSALWVLNVQQLKRPDDVYGVHDKDNPEGGDIQITLEEMLEGDPEIAALCKQTLDAYYGYSKEALRDEK